MKQAVIVPCFALAALLVCFSANAQSIAPVDAVALLNELPAPATDLAVAYQRSFTKGATSPDAKLWYKKSIENLEAANAGVQSRMLEFYKKYPTGMPPASKPAANRVSAQQKASMEAATSKLAQKMLSDPAFAQKFSKMSEKEQHAYMAQMLSDEGIKPVQGTANIPSDMPAGLDRPWAEICSELMSAASDMTGIETQNALQMRYDARHDEVARWAEAEIQKLPLIVFGEYGRDRDPEKVRAIEQQMREKHCTVANDMMKEAAQMLLGFRQKTAAKIQIFNNEIKSVQYGQQYDFGLHYPLVLQTQAFIISEIHTLLSNEISLTEACAKWDEERRSGAKQDGK